MTFAVPSRRRILVVALGVCALFIAARPAQAQRLHADQDLIAGFLRSLPSVARPVVLDIDHDGDLDVVASTPDDAVAIWINDGRGHLTRQRHAPVSAGMTAAGTIASDVPGDTPGPPPSPRHLGGLTLVESPWPPRLESDAMVVPAAFVADWRALAAGPARAPPRT